MIEVEARIRIRWRHLLWAGAAAVFVVGLVVIVQKAGSLVPWHHKVQAVSSGSGAAGQITSIDNANFAYLVPGQSQDWKYDGKNTAFDQTRGVVKFQATYKAGSVDVTISEQQMPTELKPRGSDKFKAFIDGSKPTHTQDVAGGTVYYLPALVNGGQSPTGSDTTIYATDDILMFGRAGAILNFDTWERLLSSMRKTDPKQH